jgi:hypothetical protein
MAFSQDGRTLYLLYFCGLDLYLADWDVRTGQGGTRKLRGIGDVGSPRMSGMFEIGPLVQCLSDGKLLVAGYMIVDPKSGAVVRSLPAPSLENSHRRIIGAKWARTVGPVGARRLVVEAIPDS